MHRLYTLLLCAIFKRVMSPHSDAICYIDWGFFFSFCSLLINAGCIEPQKKSSFEKAIAFLYVLFHVCCCWPGPVDEIFFTQFSAMCFNVCWLPVIKIFPPCRTSASGLCNAALHKSPYWLLPSNSFLLKLTKICKGILRTVPRFSHLYAILLLYTY